MVTSPPRASWFQLRVWNCAAPERSGNPTTTNPHGAYFVHVTGSTLFDDYFANADGRIGDDDYHFSQIPVRFLVVLLLRSQCIKGRESATLASWSSISSVSWSFSLLGDSITMSAESKESEHMAAPAAGPTQNSLPVVEKTERTPETSSSSSTRVSPQDMDVERGMESPRTQELGLDEPLPPLHTPHRRRRLLLWSGVIILTLDLCYLPITYYYALKFGTSLSLQDSMSSTALVSLLFLIDKFQYSLSLPPFMAWLALHITSSDH